MLNKVRRFIASEHLLQADRLYLVALSGGADSVCLLLCLKELGYRIEAVHCNFHVEKKASVTNSTVRSYVYVRTSHFIRHTSIQRPMRHSTR